MSEQSWKEEFYSYKENKTILDKAVKAIQDCNFEEFKNIRH